MNDSLPPPDAATLSKLSPRLLPELKRYLKHHFGHMEQSVTSYGESSGTVSSAKHAKAIDGLVSSLFHASVATAGGQGVGVALAAVGSYGRCTLSPYSDLDVRVLCNSQPERAAAVTEALLYPLWDAGLNIGHQVVALDEIVELGRADLPTATSLLDWRHLAGKQELTEQLLSRCFAGVFGPDEVGGFLQKLLQAAYARKERYGASVFLLEPDVKNGSGGLRDGDIAHWAARARWRVGHLRELVSLGVLLPDEWMDLQQATEFLMRLRNALHVSKKRKVDRISFEEQEYLGKAFGYGTGGRGAEALMSDYYRHARVVELTSEMIVRRAMPPPKVKPTEVFFGDGTKQVGDSMALEDEDALFLEPGLAFLVFHQAVKRELKVADSTRRAITRAVSSESFQARLRNDATSISLFRQLVNQPKETRFKFGSVLNELHEVGLLLAMIPEFLPVVGRVHHDVYHVYTVDIHSIAAVDKQRAIFRGVEGKSFPLASKLARMCEQREVLFFATLLHDVGKDTGGRQHAARGAELSRTILTRLRFQPREIEAVANLVDIHLKMYLFATRRDIDDPRTLESFSAAVVDEVGLRNLYLLTVCDVATTSPTSLTPWKLKMMDDLYAATHLYLVDGEQRRVATDKLIAEVRTLISPQISEDLLTAFIESVPSRYLTAFDASSVVKHLALVNKARTGVAADVTQEEGPQLQVTVVGDDEPGFLANVCAAFNFAHFKVVSAQIHSWRETDGRPRAVDSFWVTTGNQAGKIWEALQRFERTLRDVVSKKVVALELVQAVGNSQKYAMRSAPAVPIQVRVDNQEATDRTIVEVITQDRVGLLFWIAETFFESGLSIDLAKIHTEGARVTDVFYVTTRDRKKLLDEDRIEELRERLLQRLHQLEGKTYDGISTGAA